MRTLLFLLGGFLLLAAFLLLTKLFSANFADATRWATIAYIALWFIIAAANMWIGVAKAGYSVAEELPIFLLIFGLPAAGAILIKWRFL
jgi:hypothetical protein